MLLRQSMKTFPKSNLSFNSHFSFCYVSFLEQFFAIPAAHVPGLKGTKRAAGWRWDWSGNGLSSLSQLIRKRFCCGAFVDALFSWVIFCPMLGAASALKEAMAIFFPLVQFLISVP